MARLAAVTVLSALAAFAATGGALGQTVADYEDALVKAPITDQQAPASAAHCRPLMNYVFTSMPGEGRIGWPGPLVAFSGSGDPAISAKRDVCGEIRRQAIIAFDGGTGEQILTPAQELQDPNTNQPYYRDPVPTGPGGEVVVPRTGRATPQNPIRRTP